MDALPNHVGRVLQFILRGFEVAASYCGEKSCDRIIVSLQISPIGITQFTRQGVMDIGKFDLLRDVLIAQNRKPRQYARMRSSASRSAARQSFRSIFASFRSCSKLTDSDILRPPRLPLSALGAEGS
jgi:hypothetical protein